MITGRDQNVYECSRMYLSLAFCAYKNTSNVVYRTLCEERTLQMYALPYTIDDRIRCVTAHW
jgi:hypothetical protein